MRVEAERNRMHSCLRQQERFSDLRTAHVRIRPSVMFVGIDWAVAFLISRRPMNNRFYFLLVFTYPAEGVQ